MSDDLVKRLRWPGISGPDDHPVSVKLRVEAADRIGYDTARIEALEAENARLRAGINGVVNFQSGMTRSQVRESCAEILDNKTVGLNNQSPFTEAMLGYKARAAAAESEVARLREAAKGSLVIVSTAQARADAAESALKDEQRKSKHLLIAANIYEGRLAEAVEVLRPLLFPRHTLEQLNAARAFVQQHEGKK